jgi:transcriptional regulator with XRE-family HTH domain
MKQRNSGQATIEDEYSQLLKSLGKRIKTLRKERGLTLRQMEIIHGYRDSDWRKLERAGAGNMALLLKVARGFEISLSTLLKGLEQCGAQEDNREYEDDPQESHAFREAPN